MTTEINPSTVRVSNWTLATGAKPGCRYVDPGTPQDAATPSQPVARS